MAAENIRVLVIQNSANSPCGLLEKFLLAEHQAHSSTISANQIIRVWKMLPYVDLVVVLGSPESVNRAELQWIDEELNFVKEVIACRCPLFGICFGAQLIARAIGGVVKPMKLSYRGWFENEEVIDSGWRGPWLRWHGEQIIIPAAATVLASSSGVVQSFQYGLALGVQFHPEVEQDTVIKWLSSYNEKAGAVEIDEAALMSSTAMWGNTSRDRAYFLFREIFRRIRLRDNVAYERSSLAS